MGRKIKRLHGGFYMMDVLGCALGLTACYVNQKRHLTQIQTFATKMALLPLPPRCARGFTPIAPVAPDKLGI